MENCYAANEQLNEGNRTRLLKALSPDTLFLLLIRWHPFHLDFDCDYGRAGLVSSEDAISLWPTVQLIDLNNQSIAIGMLRCEFVNDPICLVGIVFCCGRVRCSEHHRQIPIGEVNSLSRTLFMANLTLVESILIGAVGSKS